MPRLEPKCVCGGHDAIDEARVHYYRDENGKWYYEVYLTENSGLLAEGEAPLAWKKDLDEQAAGRQGL